MEINRLIEGKRENNLDVYKELVEENRGQVVSSLSEIIGKRAYFTIDDSGSIKRKTLNYALPLIAYTKDKTKLSEYLLELAEPNERVKHKKIERLSREDYTKLKKNYNKILANNNLDFAKRYSKELYLRDKDLFFKILFNYILMEDIHSQKSLVALSLKKLMYKEYNDNILNTAISYICGVRSDLREYEIIATSKEEKKGIIDEINKRIGDITSKEELNLLAYSRVLEEYEYNNEGVYAEILIDNLASLKIKNKLNTYEQEILNGMQ